MLFLGIILLAGCFMSVKECDFSLLNSDDGKNQVSFHHETQSWSAPPNDSDDSGDIFSIFLAPHSWRF